MVLFSCCPLKMIVMRGPATSLVLRAYPSMQEAGSNMKFIENRGPLHQNSSEFLKTQSITQLNVVVALEMINVIKLCKDLSFM